MFNNNFIKGLALFASSAIFSLSTIQSAYAAPGVLSPSPLFLSTIVEPNVFFTLDDSGSMDWGPMVKDGTAGLTTDGGLPYIDGRRRAHYAPTFSRLYTNRYVVPPADGTDPEWDRGWVIRNHLANRNYYDPAVKYVPWAGSDASGNPMYTDADPTRALKDPNNPGGQAIALTVFHSFTEGGSTSNTMWIPTYFVWDDTDGDGVIEQTDGRTPIEIAAGTPEMQNFANWFQYYRSRINATKSVIGATINNTDASRMGMRLYNAGHQKDSKTMGDKQLKRELLERLYNIVIPRAGTPARRALRDTGNYFRNIGGPILPAAGGGECQQNFSIIMSDGFWNGSSPEVGNTDIDGAGPFDGNAAQSNDGGNYADGESDTMADVAMRDYETDLRGDLADFVPTTIDVDEAAHQHLVTFTIAFGLNGTLDPTVDDPLAAGFTWPTPVANTETTVDDMWHAGYNGRGQYLNAQNPEQMEKSLNVALSDIAQRTATAAAASINSAKLTTQSVVYLTQFNTNRWQGNLFAFKIVDLDTGALAATPDWAAADELNSRDIVVNPRTVVTHDGADGVPFQWLSLSAAQKADLKTSPSGGVDTDALGSARLDYLRGDRSNEGTGLFFRKRLSLLGDLVNSGAVFVGKPDLNWPDTAPFPTLAGARYSDFKNGPTASRDGMVWAGANDSMLHGFAEIDGEERFAYIPNVLFSTASGAGLHYLTDPTYGHRYYNDLTPTLSDIYADIGNGTKWQTVLISGLRGGERGIYALDVNDPNALSEANANKVVLWEFTNSDDPDLGYTYSRPQIGMTNAGTWVAIFGNGYNDTGDGEAKLFIVEIAKGVDGSWAAGDYVEITTNSGDPANRNGLATPALADLDDNGTIDYVYAGDLFGQMWGFDLRDSAPALWSIPGNTPLFTTKGNRPITAKPTLARHPSESDTATNAPNVMVYFGSGQYLTNADKTNSFDNYFYGVWDRGAGNLNETDLVQQTYNANFAEHVLTRNPVDYAGGADYGWFFELPNTGERSVTSPVVRGGIVFFNSFVPTTDPCSVGGFGFRFAVDMATGGSPDEVTTDVNNDGVIDDKDGVVDAVGNIDTVAAIRQEGFLPEPVFIEDIVYTAETPSKVVKLKDLPTGRFSWQELIR
jgi:type IV pilus assembly protein PilY1